MIKMKVVQDDLLNFIGFMGTAGQRTKSALVKSLNETGTALVQKLVTGIADEMGVPVHDVQDQIRVRKATPGELEFSADLSDVYENDMSSRDVPRSRRDPQERERETEPFAPGALVSIITAGDEKVCQICEEAAEEGPYTIEEARRLVPHHPHCRCAVIPFYPKQRLPVRFQTQMGSSPRGVSAPTELMTLTQLASRLKTELAFALKVTKT